MPIRDIGNDGHCFASLEVGLGCSFVGICGLMSQRDRVEDAAI